MPLDPGREWLAAGITGLQRQREWDAVATAEVDGIQEDEVEFVALPDGTFVVESEGRVDPAPFAHALGDDVELPFRALAVRRPGMWAVGAVSIEAVRLDPDPRGNELALTWNESTLELTIDGVPAEPSRGEALQRIAASRVAGAYAARARRLQDDVWELSVLAL